MKLDILNNILHQNLTLEEGDVIITYEGNRYRHYQLIKDLETDKYRLLRLETFSVLATFASDEPEDAIKYLKSLSKNVNIVAVIRSKNIKMGLI
ncbi:hypothetical protein ACQKIY_25590 [Bacillus mycoides]|uniref:hypothetical protein n=1 Tax=Bacillus mycoides TaxID=1405 RepID=UPI003D07727D